MTSIQDATVLITGANGGIGSALVAAALARGARRVYASARTPRAGDDARVVPLALDVNDPASIDRAAEQAADTTILVNNAAIFPRGALLNAPWDDVEATIGTNLLAPIRLARAFAPALTAAHGALVNVNSVLSWFAVGGAHSVSKAGLWMATNALRLDLAPAGVQVLGVYPGPTDTAMQPGDDRSGMMAPADVAAATFDALEAGEHEVLISGTTEHVHAALTAPLSALYPSLAE